MKNVTSWFSLASSTGISVVSLGTLGTTNVDEQVFTGGIQAVHHLLTTEIGSQERDFIGGGDTRKMGRFVISSPGSENEVVSQFLLMSKDGKKIIEPLIDLVQNISKTFATLMALSPIWHKAEASYSTLGPLEVMDIFLESATQSRRKIKAPSSDELFNTKINNILLESVNSFEYSEVLEKIVKLEPSIEEIQSGLKLQNLIKREIPNYINELVGLMLYQDPTPLILRSKPNDAIKETNKLFKKFQSNLLNKITTDQLEKITTEFFDDDIAEILERFGLLDLRELRPRIFNTLSNQIFLRVAKKAPLILLANPKLESAFGSFANYINSKVEIIFQEYDLASILGKISAKLLVNENPVSQLLLSEFIRKFSMKYSTGLSIYGWSYIQTLFKIFSTTGGISVKEALTELIISDSHLDTINSQLKEIKPSRDLKSLIFEINQEGDEIIKFYTALEQVITESIQNFFDEVIWTPKQLGLFSQIYGERLEYLTSQVQYLSSFIRMLSYIHSQKLDFIKADDYIPTINELIEAKNGANQRKEEITQISDFELQNLWRPNFITKSLEKKLTNIVKQEISLFFNDFQLISRESTEAQNKFKKIIKTLLKKPGDIPDDFVIIQPTQWTNLIFSKSQRVELWRIYSKSIVKIQKNAQEITHMSTKVLQKKKKEKDFHKLINKLEDETVKLIERNKRKFEDLKRKVIENENKYSKNSRREITKIGNQLNKIFNNSILPEFLIKDNKDKDFNFVIPKIQEIASPLTSVINNRLGREIHPRINELALLYSSIIIFNHLPKQTMNEIINSAVIDRGRNSVLISNIITDLKNKFDETDQYQDLEETIRKEFRKITEQKIKIILETIISRINKSYFKSTIKTHPLTTSNFEEISCIDLGEIRMLSKIFRDKIPPIFGSKLHFVDNDKQPKLLYEIGQFPSSGASLPVTRALASATWNKLVANELGFYIEIIKMSCELLGEQKRRKFQEFISTIYELIFHY